MPKKFSQMCQLLSDIQIQTKKVFPLLANGDHGTLGKEELGDY